MLKAIAIVVDFRGGGGEKKKGERKGREKGSMHHYVGGFDEAGSAGVQNII